MAVEGATFFFLADVKVGHFFSLLYVYNTRIYATSANKKYTPISNYKLNKSILSQNDKDMMLSSDVLRRFDIILWL